MKVEPSVLLAGGADEYLRRRFVAKIAATRRADGWTIAPIDGSEKNALGPVFSMSEMFLAPTLCVVSNPEKLSPAVIAEQVKSPDPKVVLLLVTDLDKPTGPIFDLVPKGNIKLFPLPPFYKLDEYAADFAVIEAKARGNPIDASLALALVKKVGSDLGVLHFEVQKAGVFAGPGVAITAAHLKETLAALSETDGTAIVEALGVRDRRRLAVELAKYRASRGGDPTIELCGRILTPTITRWLQASHLEENRMSPASAAGSVGANPWFWENKVLPYARRWKVSGCTSLIRVVAKSQTLVFQGAISPFAYLEASFLSLLQE